MFHKCLKALSLALLVAAAPAAAQTAIIRGTVKSDRDEMLQAAQVQFVDLNIQVLTGVNGQYTVTIPAARIRGQEVLMRVRSIGHKPVTRTITLNPGEQSLDFVLPTDINLLEAIVVTGVQEATEKVKTPFDVTRVDLANMPMVGNDPLKQLQGKVGANIVSFNGRPGAQASVLLRGPTSINGEGRSQDPLYIVDDVIINGSLPDINPGDIESVEVIKGAAGASLYGARAGNGVISIRTKTGRRLEGVQFTAKSEGGASDIERDFGLARFHAMVVDQGGTRFCQSVSGQPTCARTFDYYKEQARINNALGDFALTPPGFPVDPGSNITGAVLRQRFQNMPWPGTGYNAVKQTVDPHPFMQHSLDMSGRFGGTRFYASAANATDQGAIRFLTGYQRNSFRANVDQTVGTTWNIGLTSYYSRSDEDGLNQEQGNAFFRLTRVPAIVNIDQRDSLGRLFIRPNLQGGGSQNQNPLQELENTERTDVTSRFLGGLNAVWTPLSWATIEGNLGYDLRRVSFSQINDKGFRTTISTPATNNGRIFRGASGNEEINTSVNARISHTIGRDLKVRLSARYLFEQRDQEQNTGVGNFLAVKGVTALDNVTQNKDVASTFQRVRQMGVFGGGGFEFKERYIFDALIRKDGSSLFGAGNRWGTFGRVSLAWRVGQEPFWFLPMFSEFKIRGSYGTAGNSPRFTAQYETFTIGNGGILTLNVLGNRSLKPEVNKEWEGGLDLELWDRIGLSGTYAISNTENQILQPPVSSSTGYSRQWVNAGTMQNKTLELQLSVPVIANRNMTWTWTAVYNRNRSVITELGIPSYSFGTGQQGAGSIFQAKQGERYGTFYGRYFLKGVEDCAKLAMLPGQTCGGPTSDFQVNDEGWLVWVGAGNNPNMGISNNLWNSFLPSASAPWGVGLSWGFPIILRGNANNPQDALQVPLGNALPDFRVAFTQNFTWKRLTVYALLDAAFGQEIFNEGFHWAHLDFLSKDVDQAGKSVETAKPIGYYYRAPAPDGTGLGGFYDILGPNSFTVESGSYAKLRELTVAYHVGRIGGIGDWEIGLNGRNLYTFSKYRGFDPEVGISGGDTGSGAINAVDAFAFPNTRQFTVRVSTTF